MHVQAEAFIKKAIADRGPFTGHVVELGSRDVNGGVRNLFPDAKSYLGIDIDPGPDIDLVIDAADWVPDKKYCCVVSTETFEHTPRWPEILLVAATAITPDGVVLITCATSPRRPHSAQIDEHPPKRGEYYGNVSPADFLQAARKAGLKPDISVDHAHGDLYAICTLAGKS